MEDSARGFSAASAMGKSLLARVKTGPAHEDPPGAMPATPLTRLFLASPVPGIYTSESTVHVLLELEGSADIPQIKAVLRERLPRFPRMVSILDVSDKRRPIWRPCTLALDEHMTETTLSAGETVESYCNAVCMRRLDASRPLWELHVIRHRSPLSTNDSPLEPVGDSLVFRICHAIGDGPAIGHAIMSLADPLQGDPPTPPMADISVSSIARTAAGDRLRFLPSFLLTWWVLLLYFWNTILGALKLLTLFLFLRADQQTSIKVPWLLPDNEKQVHDVPALSLDEIKRAGRGAGGATVNEVLITCLSTAVRRYLCLHPSPPDLRNHPGLWHPPRLIQMVLGINDRVTPADHDEPCQRHSYTKPCSCSQRQAKGGLRVPTAGGGEGSQEGSLEGKNPAVEGKNSSLQKNKGDGLPNGAPVANGSRHRGDQGSGSGRCRGRYDDDVCVLRPPPESIRLVVAVNTRPYRAMLRGADAMDEIVHPHGNAFGYYVLPLHLSDVSPRQRLAQVKASLRAMRCSWLPLLAQRAVAWTVRVMGGKAAMISLIPVVTKTSTALTSVRGPSGPLSIAGQRVIGVKHFTTGSPQATCFHVTSYCDDLVVSITTNPDVVECPRLLCRLVLDAWHEFREQFMAKT